MDKFLAVLALLILAGFISILLFAVPRFDLIAVCAITFGLAAYDFWTNLKAKRDSA